MWIDIRFYQSGRIIFWNNLILVVKILFLCYNAINDSCIDVKYKLKGKLIWRKLYWLHLLVLLVWQCLVAKIIRLHKWVNNTNSDYCVVTENVTEKATKAEDRFTCTASISGGHNFVMVDDRVETLYDFITKTKNESFAENSTDLSEMMFQ